MLIAQNVAWSAEQPMQFIVAIVYKLICLEQHDWIWVIDKWNIWFLWNAIYTYFNKAIECIDDIWVRSTHFTRIERHSEISSRTNKPSDAQNQRSLHNISISDNGQNRSRSFRPIRRSMNFHQFPPMLFRQSRSFITNSGLFQNLLGLFSPTFGQEPNGTFGNDEVIQWKYQCGGWHDDPGLSPVWPNVCDQSYEAIADGVEEEVDAQAQNGSPFAAKDLHHPDPTDCPSRIWGKCLSLWKILRNSSVYNLKRCLLTSSILVFCIKTVFKQAYFANIT